MPKIIPYDQEILPTQEAEKLPYYDDLVRIRRAFENDEFFIRSYYKFPKGDCCSASKAVNLVTGLEELAGHYTPKVFPSRRSKFKRWHAWNYDKERELYVDLTQDQFLETLPSIVILASDTKILHPTQHDTQDQIAYEISFLRISSVLKKVRGN